MEDNELTVTITLDNYEALICADQREELLLEAFSKAAKGDKYYKLRFDCDVLETAFALLYPDRYKRVASRCEAEHQAAKAGDES